jgi:uncharacterized protein
MDIVVTGASGFIGRALTHSLEADGHRVVPLVRPGSHRTGIAWDLEAGTIDHASLEGIDAVVHLAGESIASGPWTTKQRARIHESRAQGTALLARALAKLEHPPATLLSGSAIGIYGDRGDEPLTETSSLGHDFLAEVCVAWEAATDPAAAAGVRVAHLRTGIVLDPAGGAFAKQLPLFRFGLGGRAGKGTQWMSWITLHDEVRAIRFLLEHPDVSGPVNLAAPAPATNAEFTRALGAALHRPTFLTVPRFASKAPFGIGGLVESLLFSSARVLPSVLTHAGFDFHHTELVPAVEQLVGGAAST